MERTPECTCGKCRHGEEIEYNRRWCWPWYHTALWDWRRRMALPATGREPPPVESPAARWHWMDDTRGPSARWPLVVLIWRAVNAELREDMLSRPQPTGHATIGGGNGTVLKDIDADGGWANVVRAYEDWR